LYILIHYPVFTHTHISVNTHTPVRSKYKFKYVRLKNIIGQTEDLRKKGKKRKMNYFISDLKINTVFYLDPYDLSKKFIKISLTKYRDISTNKEKKIKAKQVCFAENL